MSPRLEQAILGFVRSIPFPLSAAVITALRELVRAILDEPKA